MHTPIKLLLILLCCPVIVFSQRRINLSDIKYDRDVYIFIGRPSVTKSDGLGTPLPNERFPTLLAENNSTFTVHRKISTGYVISFRHWSTKKSLFESEDNHLRNLQKALKFNYHTPDSSYSTFTSEKAVDNKTTLVRSLPEEAFFLITENDLKDFGYFYDPRIGIEFNFGTISYLARMRTKVSTIPGRWSTDLNLGLTAGPRVNIGKNAGLSLLVGIGVTKINLDSATTGGAVRTTSEKPALTPSLSAIFSFQNVSIGFGIGLDWVNRDSNETAAWIYNNRIFYGVAFGINIFRSSSNTTTSKQDQ